MYALSIRQPFAWLLANGWKLVENRGWHTNHRGPLLIHASRTVDREALADLLNYFASLGETAPAELYDVGGIVGLVDLLDCTRDPARLTPNQLADYDGIGYAWIMANPQPCQLIPYPGRLRLFDVPQSLIDNQ